MKAHPVPQELRKAILERDNYTCCRCDELLQGYNYSLHHRLPRGRGGTHTAENIVTLCGNATGKGCHNFVESYRKQATAAGWLVPSGVDPANWPIYRAGHWLQPTADGWVPAQPPE